MGQYSSNQNNMPSNSRGKVMILCDGSPPSSSLSSSSSCCCICYHSECSSGPVESEQNESRYDLSPAQHQYCLYINGIFHSSWFPLPWVLHKSSSFLLFLDVSQGFNHERNYVLCIKLKEVIGNNTFIEVSQHP